MQHFSCEENLSSWTAGFAGSPLGEQSAEFAMIVLRTTTMKASVGCALLALLLARLLLRHGGQAEDVVGRLRLAGAL